LIYTKDILDAYKNKKHFGEIENPMYAGSFSNPTCSGDEMLVTLNVDKNGKISEIKYLSHGCCIAVGVADIMCEYLIGKKMTLALTLSDHALEGPLVVDDLLWREFLWKDLGIFKSLSSKTSYKCAKLFFDAFMMSQW